MQRKEQTRWVSSALVNTDDLKYMKAAEGW